MPCIEATAASLPCLLANTRVAELIMQRRSPGPGSLNGDAQIAASDAPASRRQWCRHAPRPRGCIEKPDGREMQCSDSSCTSRCSQAGCGGYTRGQRGSSRTDRYEKAGRGMQTQHTSAGRPACPPVASAAALPPPAACCKTRIVGMGGSSSGSSSSKQQLSSTRATVAQDVSCTVLHNEAHSAGSSGMPMSWMPKRRNSSGAEIPFSCSQDGSRTRIQQLSWQESGRPPI